MWAKQLGIPTYTLTNPLRLREAAAGLAEGSIHRVDVGQANERHFLCWAGIGLDAQVTTEMEPRKRRTKRLGVLPYIVAAVTVARDFQGVRTRVSLDGDIVRVCSTLPVRREWTTVCSTSLSSKGWDSSMLPATC
jgi:diacylglycerol kinase family enzyme